MSFEVIKPGFLTTVQDYGRFGYSAQGLARCGAMDEHAYQWGNYLLGNDFKAASLEITFGNVHLRARTSAMIALTGADLDFKINQKSQSLWRCLRIKKGDELTWGASQNGVRGYLAVRSGFATPTLFGSRSVNLREQIGGQLSAGDILPFKTLREDDLKNNVWRFMARRYQRDYSADLVLRVVPSYQFENFSQSQKDVFFNQTYAISPANNRTGCRLDGIAIKGAESPLISEGMSDGSVEITPDGRPIILLKDAPTIGGYPKIGTVFSLDLAKLAQKQTGDKIRFEPMRIEQAQAERREFNQFFAID